MIALDIDAIKTRTKISVESDHISRLDWDGILTAQRGDVQQSISNGYVIKTVRSH